MRVQRRALVWAGAWTVRHAHRRAVRRALVWIARRILVLWMHKTRRALLLRVRLAGRKLMTAAVTAVRGRLRPGGS